MSLRIERFFGALGICDKPIVIALEDVTNNLSKRLELIYE